MDKEANVNRKEFDTLQVEFAKNCVMDDIVRVCTLQVNVWLSAARARVRPNIRVHKSTTEI